MASIFDFDDHVDYLLAVFGRKQEINAKFSLRAWAKQMGLSNPGHLSLALNRKRPISPMLQKQIRKSLDLSSIEEQYFDLLILRSNAPTGRERKFFEASMDALRPGRDHKQISEESFAVIASWYHIVIMEMTFLDAFQPDPDWIAERLKFAVERQEIVNALERLMRLGMLVWTKEGRLVKADPRLQTTNDIPSKALITMHHGMIANAATALHKDPVNQRDITMHVIATNKEKMLKAKEMIRQFRFTLARFLETDGPRDAVFNLNIQLFDNITCNVQETKP
jgi:uncharacterized protein (TIGR02147 family)